LGDGFRFTDKAPTTHTVAAVVLMGDPSFVAGLSWDNGTAENVSYFPRLDTASCDPIADKSKSEF
jgi:hypothetical protein